jgi:hypothetical protein
MSDKYQSLRDALKAEPIEGPFTVTKEKGTAYSYDITTEGGYYVATTHGFVKDRASSLSFANYIAAANPATITALLADLDAEKARLQWLISQHWVEPEAVFRLNLSGTDDAAAYEQEAYNAIDAALSQIKAAGREQS